MATIFMACSILDRPELQFMQSYYKAKATTRHEISECWTEKFAGLAALRNMLISRFLQGHWDYFCSLDSDLILYNCERGNNIFDRLIAHDKEFTGGLYASRNPLANQVHTSCPVDQSGMNPAFDSGLVEMKWLAGGCWMVKREAIKRAAEMFADTLRYDDNPAYPSYALFNDMVVTLESGKRKLLSEDWSFCERLRQAGCRLWADTRIILGHMGSLERRIWGMIPHLGGSQGVCNKDEGALRALRDRFSLKTMVDIGCGLGGMKMVAEGLGMRWGGIEGDPDVLQPWMIRHDFTKAGIELDPAPDLAWATEFVEHLEEKFLHNFFATIANVKVVCITHAPPGANGYHHVNCRESSYWVRKFEENGWKLDADATEEVRKASTMERDYMRKTGFVFVKT